MEIGYRILCVIRLAATKDAVKKAVGRVKGINICVCDDDPQICERVKELLRQIIPQEEPAHIDLFFSGEGLIRAYKHGATYDLIFLDVEMPVINGLETGKSIRKLDSRVCIVLLTEYQQYALDSYELHPYGYLLKPATIEKIRNIYLQILSDLALREQEFLRMRESDRYLCIPYTDIIFIERRKSKVKVYNGKREIWCAVPWGEFSNLLDQRFLQIHSDYIVNLDYYDEIVGRYRGMRLHGHCEVIPIERRKKRAVLEGLIRYVDYHG